jgi:integrase
MNLARAKFIATKHNELLANGRDPREVQKEDAHGHTTFGQIIEPFIQNQTHWTKSQHYNAKLYLCKYGKPLHDVPVFKLTASEIHEALKELEQRARPQAKRALKMMYLALEFARNKNKLILYRNENQAKWEIQVTLWPRRSNSGENHHDMMPHKDVPAFMKMLRGRQARSTAAVALEFLILTACRNGEVRAARWEEIDWENKVWTIPAVRMKKKWKEHRVPLTSRMLELLRQQQEVSPGPYVFRGQIKGRPLEDKAMYKFLRNTGVRGATVHGFRASFRTWSRNKAPFDTLEQCLSHKVGTATSRAYDRSDEEIFEERREVMEKWDRYCTGT